MPHETNSQSAPNRIWTVFFMMFASVALVIFFQVILVVGFGIVEANETQISQEYFENLPTRPEVILAGLLCNQLVMAGVVLGAVLLSKQAWRNRLDIHKISYPAHIWIALCLTTIGFSSIVDLFLPTADSVASIQDALQSQSWGYRLIFMIAGSILPGICEELLCRGYIETRLLTRWSPPAAIFVTSLFFGLLHMDIFHAISAFFIGAWFGWLHLQTKSIIPGMVCHFFNNALSYVITIFLSYTAMSSAINLGINLFFSLCGIGALIVFLKYQKT